MLPKFAQIFISQYMSKIVENDQRPAAYAKHLVKIGSKCRNLSQDGPAHELLVGYYRICANASDKRPS